MAWPLKIHSLLAVCALALALGAASASARPASEWSEPGGRFEGMAPKGYVLLIHGGGWSYVGRGMLGFMYSDRDHLTRAGYATLNIDYRRHSAGMADVRRFYDRLRRRAGRHATVCALGSSSGGHLALVLARQRRSLDCVIARAAPTELATLPRPLRRLAHRAFDGAGGLARWSVASRQLRLPVLLEHARHDPYVPFGQSRRLRGAARRLIALRRGPRAWVHVGVRARDLRRARRAELAFLRGARRAGTDAPRRASASAVISGWLA